MQDDKVEAMEKALAYGLDYWDGDRRYGYGGYGYDGRWAKVARQLIDIYGLGSEARILDVGCGKGYLLYEFTRLLPSCEVTGIDISDYALQNAKLEVADRLMVHRAQDPFPFEDGQFDLAVSFNTLHNLHVDELKSALGQMTRCARRQFFTVESYRTARELFNLQCWALTCAAFFTPREWVWLMEQFGYSGDYEFIYFE